MYQRLKSTTDSVLTGRLLGHGGDAIVHETMIHNHKLALKRTWRKRSKGLKIEIEHLKKLSHHHLICLIGSYTGAGWVGLLLHPVAICDLALFFEDAEAFWKGHVNCNQASRLEQLGYELTSSFKHKAWPIYSRIGCLTSAVSYLHSQKIQIRHKDLKTSNILLLRDKIYLSDFGSATDFPSLSQSKTDGGGGTRRYLSPEVGQYTFPHAIHS